MERKFSIAQGLDLDKLAKKINEYQLNTGETEPYLFMNKNTLDIIPPPAVDDTLSLIKKVCVKADGVVGCYLGYKVFRDDSLKFGEVEIR